MSTATGKDGTARPRVVIVGAGFAGLNAARSLRKAPVEVVLVDRNNYHRFEPLLYQVATAALEPDEIAHPVRDIFRSQENVRFRLGTVRAVDAENRRLLLRSGPPIDYDYLILAAGAVSSYFGIDGVEDYAFPLKNMPDAINLRNHILRQFERYDRSPETMPAGALNFVIVGGGPTGVETAGALTELFRHVLQKDFKTIDTGQARVYLLEMLPSLLPAYHDSLSAYTRSVLEQRGVQVMTETTVERVTEEAVHLKDRDPIPTQTLIWAAGIAASPLGGTLGTPQGKGGRLEVDADLSVPGHPEIFVVGDMGGGKDHEGNPYPQLAPVAIQQGKFVAAQVQRRLAGEEPEPFHYRDPGIMATIGRNAAVAQLAGGLRLTGFVAWIMWAFLHVAKLVGFRNRANVMINWIYNYLTYDRNARLILDVVPISDEIPHEVEYVDAKVRERIGEISEEES